jgi:RHS repeat-associated protein
LDGAQFDHRGKMISAHTESPLGSADLLFSYSGLGAVTAFEQTGTIGGFSSEEFIVDALGNRSERRQMSDLYDPGDPQRHRTLRYNAWNQLDGIDGDPPTPPYNNYYAETYLYDPAGNTTLFHKNTNTSGAGGDVTYNDSGVDASGTVSASAHGGGPRAVDSTARATGARSDVFHQDSHISYYGADNKLRVFNRHIGIGPASADTLYGERGVFEEYRYDALGRRVFERTRRIGAGCPSTLDCQSRATRTVWDGDRILYEIRSPGGEIINGNPPPPPDSTTNMSTSPDQSVALIKAPHGPNESELLSRLDPGASGLLTAVDTIPDPGIEGEATVIGYTHALGISGIDEPVEIRANSQSIFPHTGWRGMLAMGTYANGARSDCGVANPCDRIDWPAANVTIDRGGYARTEPTTWYGSLASAGSEGSGFQYMRNRYYDPKRGQFTQADPIGLGGGLSLYGFGNGDPVGYNDPFGLCPFCGDEAAAYWAAVAARSSGLTRVSAVTAGLVASLWTKDTWKRTAAVLIGGEIGAVISAGAGYERLTRNFRPDNPLSSTRYTGKVRQQIRTGDIHGFPLEVDNYAGFGTTSSVRGGDGIVRTKVELRGSWRGKDGTFEWLIEPDKTVNHRIFRADK